jgi:drug/metabolite transporter (DMT)-like permease
LAVYIILTRALRQERVMPKLFHTALWSALALTPFVPFFWKAPTVHGWIILIGVAVSGWIMLFLLCRSLETAPSAIFAPAIYGMTACLHFVSVVEHHEAATRGLRLGMFIIWAAVFAILAIKWPTRYRSWAPEVVGDT